SGRFWRAFLRTTEPVPGQRSTAPLSCGMDRWVGDLLQPCKQSPRCRVMLKSGEGELRRRILGDGLEHPSYTEREDTPCKNIPRFPFPCHNSRLRLPEPLGQVRSPSTVAQ